MMDRLSSTATRRDSVKMMTKINKVELQLQGKLKGGVNRVIKETPFHYAQVILVGAEEKLVLTTAPVKSYSPDWPESVKVDYLFHDPSQTIRVRVFSCQDSSRNYATITGEVQVKVSAILNNPKKEEFRLSNNAGSLAITGRVITPEKDVKLVIDRFSCDGSFDPKTDYWIAIRKRNVADAVWRSQSSYKGSADGKSLVVDSSIEIDLSKLAENDQLHISDLSIAVEKKGMVTPFKDVEKISGNVSINQLVDKSALPYSLESTGKSSKAMRIQCHFRRHPTFYDYLEEGLQISLIVAVDYSGSNGDPKDPDSLHFISETENLYEKAIKHVISILSAYDTDQLYPVWGFGARLKVRGSEEFSLQTDNCFSLLGDLRETSNKKEKERELGLETEDVLGAYRKAVKQIAVSGPSNYAEVIQNAKAAAEEKYHTKDEESGIQHNYTVLLIITDGDIDDVNKAKEEIIAASESPLSILIVGVGDHMAPFSDMRVLDGDQRTLEYQGIKASRDIVQFVNFETVLRQEQHADAMHQNLQAQLLDELPEQVVGFMQMRNVRPKLLRGVSYSN